MKKNIHSLIFVVMSALVVPLTLTAEKLSICIGLTAGRLAAFQTYVKCFEKENPGITVEVISADGYQEALNKAREEENPYDIYHISEFGAPEFIVGRYQDKFLPVGDIAPHLNNIKFLGALEMHYGNNGKLYACPFNPSIGIVYVNKTLYDQAMQKAPNLFKTLVPLGKVRTWEQFWQVASAVRQVFGEDVKGYTHPWNAAYTYEFFSALSGSCFLSFKNGFENSKEARFTLSQNVRLVEFFTRLAKLSKEGVFCYSSDYSKEAEVFFSRGHIFALMQGASRLSAIQKSMKNVGQSFELAYLPLPYPDFVKDNAAMVPKIGGGAFFAKNNNAAVRAFLEFCIKPENQLHWLALEHTTPLTEEAHLMLKKTNYYSLHPQALVAVEQLLNRKAGEATHVRIPYYGEIRGKLFNKLLCKYLKGCYADAKAFLKDYDDSANRYLEISYKL